MSTLPRLLAILWTLGILVACSIPGQDLPNVSTLSFDKLVHGVMFAGFGGFWMHALAAPLRRRTGWVLGVGLAFAGATEIYQGLLPLNRQPDPFDFLANALGLLLALGIYRLWKARSASAASSL